MTDNQKTELLPCPFCGGEAETLTAESMYGGYLFGIMCNDCRSRGDVYDTEAEAIAAWNARAERGTLTAEQVREAVEASTWAETSTIREFNDSSWQAIADELNARAERTCEPNWMLQGETQTQEFWRCECGNCGHEFGVEDRSSFPFKMTIDKVEIPKFCPNCGAKVVNA